MNQSVPWNFHKGFDHCSKANANGLCLKDAFQELGLVSSFWGEEGSEKVRVKKR